MNITEQALDALREDIKGRMSPKRYKHTVEVEKMVEQLALLYCPEKTMMLRAAALLHDITKELSATQQLELCLRCGIELEEDAYFAPKTLHARTAAALIPTLYPELADDELVRCVRWHTTGREGMTITEKLVYLADYIDMSRTFEDCVRLREFFMSAQPESLDTKERERHLRDTLIMSYDMTIRGLLEEGLPVNKDTIAARNQLIRESAMDKAT